MLATGVATMFPIIVADGDAPESFRLLHPFLLGGFSGSLDWATQLSNKAY
jgi:hypothetical protein